MEVYYVEIFRGGFYNKDKPILKDDNLNGNLSYPAYLYDKISKVNFFQRNRINSALPVL